jgi:hypothetical protein
LRLLTARLKLFNNFQNANTAQFTVNSLRRGCAPTSLASETPTVEVELQTKLKVLSNELAQLIAERKGLAGKRIAEKLAARKQRGIAEPMEPRMGAFRRMRDQAVGRETGRTKENVEGTAAEMGEIAERTVGGIGEEKVAIPATKVDDEAEKTGEGTTEETPAIPATKVDDETEKTVEGEADEKAGVSGQKGESDGEEKVDAAKEKGQHFGNAETEGKPGET